MGTINRENIYTIVKLRKREIFCGIVEKTFFLSLKNLISKKLHLLGHESHRCLATIFHMRELSKM